ncbi:hypothetical protein [Dactylosporangium sp. CA-233914]|uniref:hypothetical protein n=1 Tax=Dactylosporangium sp. CA-233914 TaxID=3239934 RepID=UPI003D8D65F6
MWPASRSPRTRTAFEAHFDGERLAFTDCSQVAVVALDGRMLWRRETGAEDCALTGDGTLWLTTRDELIAVDAGTGREIARTDIAGPILTGPPPAVCRFDDTPCRPRLTGGRIALTVLGGAYIAGTSGPGYLSVGYSDDGALSWHDLATGATLAERHVTDIAGPHARLEIPAVVSPDYALIGVSYDDFADGPEEHLLLATRRLRPVTALDFPAAVGHPYTSTLPGRWLTVDLDEPILRTWELAAWEAQLTLL